MAIRNKKNRNKKNKRDLIFQWVGFCIGITILLIVLIVGTPQISKQLPVEKAVKKLDGYNEKTNDICRVEFLEENKAVVFVLTDCHGLHGCNGEYIIALNKLNNSWIVNESSKRALWEKRG